MNRSKYLLPYRKDNLGRFYRTSVSKYNISIILSVWYDNFIKPDGRSMWTNYYSTKWFNTKEKAMADLDKNLIKKGYVLLTEEQALLV